MLLPLLISCTFVEIADVFLLCQLAFSLALRFFNSQRTTAPSNSDFVRPSITVFRALLQYSTICAILAVDFHIFPRRFAKTETFGVSLMDVGVGGFVFSSGLVAGKSSFSEGTNPSIWNAMRSTFLVFLIGLGRMLITKFIGYQEHVSEYGVHWNFFFTLGLIPLITTLHRKYSSPLSFKFVAYTMLMYTFILRYFGLEDWILNAPRIDFVSMNREGIFSFLGYYSLFLLAAQLGNRLFKSKPSHILKMLIKELVLGHALFFIFTEILPLRVSRRMANLPYVLWIYNIAVFLIFGLVIINRVVGSSGRAPMLFDAINRNQLVIFLFANLLTGAVNLSINTIAQGSLVSFLIMASYMALVSVFALFTSPFKIKL